MPRTEHVPLFQERWRRRPFWMLVGCILVNRTTWRKASAVHAALYRFGPGHLGVVKHLSLDETRDALRPLGLHEQRARSIRALCWEWDALVKAGRLVRLTARDVLELPGCGKYAADSWAIFVEGRRPRGVTDKRLLEYLAERRRRRKPPLDLGYTVTRRRIIPRLYQEMDRRDREERG